MNADHWIETLRLEPHPEGGFYRETYRAKHAVNAEGRAASTAIYFLLRSQDVSHFHRIDADEMWHFYGGSPLTVHCLSEADGCQKLSIGPGRFQAVVPAGVWFGATVDEQGSFSLVGCTVAPGFEFSGFEMAQKSALLDAFPHQAEIINHLTASER